MTLPALLKQSLISFYTLLFFYNSSAQSADFKGYYVTAGGDTIQGSFPNYKQWNENPSRVNFVALAGLNQIILTPFNCRAFHVENYDSYIAYSGKRLKNPITYADASSGDKEDNYDTLTTFLRQIAVGKPYQFFVYKDEVRINLYYSTANQEIKELIYKTAIVNNSFWQSPIYKTQLNELYAGRGQEASIDKINYTAASLASFVNSLGGRKDIIKKLKNDNDGFIVMGGLSYNALTFNDDKSQEVTQRNYPSNMVPLGSIAYKISMKRNFDKVFWLPQVKVFSFKHKGKTYYNNNNSYPAVFNRFQASAVVAIGFHIGYNIINKHNIKLAIIPGGGINIFVKNRQVDEFLASATQQNTVTTKMNQATYLLDVQSHLTIKNKFLLWVAYHAPAPVTNGAAHGKLSSAQLSLGYKL